MDETPGANLSPPRESPPNIVRMALLFEGGLVVLAVVLGWGLATRPWEQTGGGWQDVGWGLAATAPMLVGLVVMRQVRSGPIGKLNRVVDELLLPLFGGCTLVQLAAISLVAGVGEEMLFRGVMQPKLIDWLGLAAGVAITSAAFGLVHAITVAYAVVAAAVGVYLGWLALATGGLVAPVVAHAVYDFVALVYLVRTRPGGRGLNGGVGEASASAPWSSRV